MRNLSLERTYEELKQVMTIQINDADPSGRTYEELKHFPKSAHTKNNLDESGMEGMDAKRQEAEQAGDGTAAAAYEQQADYIHWLANELRKASGQPTT